MENCDKIDLQVEEQKEILLSNSKSVPARMKSKSKRKQKDLIIKSKSKGASSNCRQDNKKHLQQAANRNGLMRRSCNDDIAQFSIGLNSSKIEYSNKPSGRGICKRKTAEVSIDSGR